MRAIHLAQLDKVRPVLVLTRSTVLPRMTTVTVAPITSRIRGLSSEVPVGRSNGLDHASVVHLDSIVTIPQSSLGSRVGALSADQEIVLTRALHLAFDLEGPMPLQ